MCQRKGFKGDVQAFAPDSGALVYAICCNKSLSHSGKDVAAGKGFGRGWLYTAPELEGAVLSTSHAGNPASQAALASPATLGAVYSFILEWSAQNVGRSERDALRRHLRSKRSLSAERQSHLAVAAVPSGAAWTRLEAACQQRFPAGLCGVPGAYTDARGQWRLRPITDEKGKEFASYWEPWADSDGFVTGLQARALAGDLRRWFSSKGRKDGCSPGTPLGFVRPVEQGVEWVGVAEGYWKGESVARYLGAAALVLPGVPVNASRLNASLASLRRRGVTELRLFPDQDCHAKANVAAGWEKVASAAISFGFTVLRYDWRKAYEAAPERCKGIDDLLNTGAVLDEPALVSPTTNAVVASPAAFAKRGRRLEVWRTDRAAALSQALPIEDAHERVRAFIRQAANAARKGERTVFVLQAAPATGKSTAATRILDEFATFMPIAYFGPRTDQRRQQWGFYGGASNKDLSGRPLCERFGEIGPALQRGVPLGNFCGTCPLRASCGYHQQPGPGKFGITYANWQTAQTRTDYVNKARLAVFDDINAYSLGAHCLAVSLADLDCWAEFIAANPAYAPCAPLVRILRDLMRGNKDLPTGAELVSELQALARAAQEDLGQLVRRVSKLLSSDAEGEPASKVAPLEGCAGKTPRKFLRRLASVLSAELREFKRNGGEWNRSLFFACKRRGAMLPASQRRLKVWRRVRFPEAQAVLWMDANASPETVCELFPNHDIVTLRVDAEIPDTVEIHQHLGERAGKVAQSGGPSQERLAKELLQRIAEGVAVTGEPSKVSVVATKAMIECIAPRAPVGIKLNWFGNCVSDNAMAGTEFHITFGTWSPNPQDLFEQVQAFYGPRALPVLPVRCDEVVEVQYAGRTETLATCLRPYADERMRAAEAYAKGETLQAIERARLPRVGGTKNLQLNLLEPTQNNERRTAIVHLYSQDPLPPTYRVHQFHGAAVDALQHKEEAREASSADLQRIVGAIRSGAVAHNAGRRSIARFLGLSEKRCRLIMKPYADQVNAARADAKAGILAPQALPAAPLVKDEPCVAFDAVAAALAIVRSARLAAAAALVAERVAEIAACDAAPRAPYERFPGMVESSVRRRGVAESLGTLAPPASNATGAPG